MLENFNVSVKMFVRVLFDRYLSMRLHYHPPPLPSLLRHGTQRG